MTNFLTHDIIIVSERRETVTAGMEAMMNRQTNTNTALYVRVDFPGNRDMTDMQINRLERYAAEHGFENLHYYVDNGFSGTDDSRPAYNQLKSDLADGVIHQLLVCNLNRLERNSHSLYRLIDGLNSKSEVSLHSVCEGVITKGSLPFLTVLKSLQGEVG